MGADLFILSRVNHNPSLLTHQSFNPLMCSKPPHNPASLWRKFTLLNKKCVHSQNVPFTWHPYPHPTTTEKSDIATISHLCLTICLYRSSISGKQLPCRFWELLCLLILGESCECSCQKTLWEVSLGACGHKEREIKMRGFQLPRSVCLLMLNKPPSIIVPSTHLTRH